MMPGVQPGSRPLREQLPRWEREKKPNERNITLRIVALINNYVDSAHPSRNPLMRGRGTEGCRGNFQSNWQARTKLLRWCDYLCLCFRLAIAHTVARCETAQAWPRTRHGYASVGEALWACSPHWHLAPALAGWWPIHLESKNRSLPDPPGWESSTNGGNKTAQRARTHIRLRTERVV